MANNSYIRAAALADVEAAKCLSVTVGGRTLALFHADGRVFAVDNRCPHMGFPLARGSVRDGILTCHWHHARFDLASGGTFDLFADDVEVFPLEIRDDAVWVDVTRHGDPIERQRSRLRDGLERSISLVIGKAVIGILDGGGKPVEPFRMGIEFGVQYRAGGWGPGLTVLTCMMNLLPHLDTDDRSHALFHGLANVAADTAGSAPRFAVRPLPTLDAPLPSLKRWFRQLIEVRDAEGAERCLVSAVRSGASHAQLADMLLAAATDHRYVDTGHVLDFTNKALEALDIAGWDLAEPVLASLVPAYASARRMEESNAWRQPIDLIEILDAAFQALPSAVAEGRSGQGPWAGLDELANVVLGDDPSATADAMLDALRHGAGESEVAGAVAYAAALRVARFHTSNEFGDWDTALHTFSFANAVHQGLQRAPSIDLLRGAFDAAMSVYLDRFLNVPPARTPQANGPVDAPESVLNTLPDLLDRRQQVDEAGAVVHHYLDKGAAPAKLVATLGSLLLREDRNFHTIQMLEAAVRQHGELSTSPLSSGVLRAAARYLAAHAPTARAQGQTYRIALRLHRGERLYEGDD